jgi:glucokinase
VSASICRVGVDIGGTGTRAIAVVADEIVSAKDMPTAQLGSGSIPQRLDHLAELIGDVVPEGAEMAAVGIGASGPVDIAKGVINNSATLPWFTGFPIVEGLEDRLHVPVGIDNDAVAAAFGEYSMGAGERADRLLMLTLGTGVGVSMLVAGKPFRGANGAHPESGHIPISSDPERCYCGLTGCFEQSASRTTLQKRLSEALAGRGIDRNLIAAAMQEASANRRVRAVFDQYAAAVGRGLASLHTVYQPTVTVIGGSAAVCFPLIEEGIHRALERSTDFMVDVSVRAATLGDNAGAIGGALQIARARSRAHEPARTS